LQKSYNKQITSINQDLMEAKDKAGRENENKIEISERSRTIEELREKYEQAKEESDRFRTGMEQLMSENQSLIRRLQDFERTPRLVGNQREQVYQQQLSESNNQEESKVNLVSQEDQRLVQTTQILEMPQIQSQRATLEERQMSSPLIGLPNHHRAFSPPPDHQLQASSVNSEFKPKSSREGFQAIANLEFNFQQEYFSMKDENVRLKLSFYELQMKVKEIENECDELQLEREKVERDLRNCEKRLREVQKREEEQLRRLREVEGEKSELERTGEECRFELGRNQQEIKFLKERIERLNDPQIVRSEKEQ